MSELEMERRRIWIRSISDEQFLFLYATRLARLANFRKLHAPAVIIENEKILTNEVVEERRNRPFSSAELYLAVGNELKKLAKRSRRAS